MSLSEQFKKIEKIKFNLYTAKNELDKLFSFTLNLDEDNVFSYSKTKFEKELINKVLTIKLTFLFEICKNNLSYQEMKNFNEYFYEKYVGTIEILKQFENISEINLIKFKVIILSWILYSQKKDKNILELYSNCINFLYKKEENIFFYDYLFKLPCVYYIKEILMKCFFENNFGIEMINYFKNIVSEEKKVTIIPKIQTKKEEENVTKETIEKDNQTRFCFNGGINNKLLFSRTPKLINLNEIKRIKMNQTSLIEKYFNHCSKTKEEYKYKINTQIPDKESTKAKIRNIVNGKFYVDEIISVKKNDLNVNDNLNNKNSKSLKIKVNHKNKTDNFENKYFLISRKFRNKTGSQNRSKKNNQFLSQKSNIENDEEEILAIKTKKLIDDENLLEKNINDSKRKRDYYNLFAQKNYY